MGLLKLLIVCVLSVPTVTGKHGPNDNVCSQAEYAQTAKVRPPQKMPELPKQWSVRIELDMIDLGYGMDVHEYYDGVNNRGAVTQWKEGMETRMIYLYDTNELIVLQFDGSGSPPMCHIDNMLTSTVKDYFGLTKYANGTEHVYTPDKALHFEGSGPEVPMGRMEGPDGTIVDAWESCAYIEEIDATLVVDWLFSASSDWMSPENMVVPIQRSAKGYMFINETYGRQIDRRYLYTDFRPLNNDPVNFQTPPGTYCKNKVSLRPLPTIPTMFSFSSEIIMPLEKHVSLMAEYYDYDLNLTRYDYTADPTTQSDYGHNKLIRVHDFNSGVAYVIDIVLGNCSISGIDALGYDTKAIDSGSIRMRTAKEFMYLDSSKYEYAGQRMVRDINSDVFITIRNDFPPGHVNPKTTFEWYFATKQWKESAGSESVSDIPVRLHVTSDDPPMNVIYNLYDYSEERPDIWKTDVSACFSADHKHDFEITFPATNVDEVTSNINLFKLAVLKTIANVTNISPIRINGLEVEIPAGAVNVIGTLLDKPPISRDVAARTTLTTLAAAVGALTNSVHHGNFHVTLPNGVLVTATSIS